MSAIVIEHCAAVISKKQNKNKLEAKAKTQIKLNYGVPQGCYLRLFAIWMQKDIVGNKLITLLTFIAIKSKRKKC